MPGTSRKKSSGKVVAKAPKRSLVTEATSQPGVAEEGDPKRSKEAPIPSQDSKSGAGIPGVNECLQFASEHDRAMWYDKAAKYWESIPATLSGVLGGFPNLTDVDVKDSRAFIEPLLETGPFGTGYVLDCGAGIGRVSKQLLLPLFDRIDLVELNKSFLEKAREQLSGEADRVGCYYAEALQTFTPESGRYDVIWIQWVLSHLTDEDLVQFLKRCKTGIKRGGLIIVKENVDKKESTHDDVDYSVTRSLDAFYKIFSECHLKIIKEQGQTNFPKNFYPIKMFALIADE